MNHEKEAEKALLGAIGELGIYGTKGFPRLLDALSWWADTKGAYGHVVSNVKNDLDQMEVDAAELQGLLDELESADVPRAIKEAKDLRKQLDEAENAAEEQERDHDKEVEKLKLEIAGLEAERDQALLIASQVP